MALIIDIKVVPASGKQLLILEKNNRIKCFLKNPPERGKANQELIKLLAAELKLPQQAIEIITGHTGRLKKIKINASYTYDQILAKLGLAPQLSIY